MPSYRKRIETAVRHDFNFFKIAQANMTWRFRLARARRQQPGGALRGMRRTFFIQCLLTSHPIERVIQLDNIRLGVSVCMSQGMLGT